MKSLLRPMTFLSSLGWRAKIYAITGFLTCGTVVVGIVGGIAILYLNTSIQDAVGAARERAAVAANARLAVIGIDREQARLISASAPDEIRQAAVAAIRAASSLDESLQILERTLSGSPQVAELIRLNQEVTSTRMAIIKAAKRKDSAKAQEESRGIADKIRYIEELSNKIYSDEQASLTEHVQQTISISHRVIFLLGLFVAASVAAGAVISFIFARQFASSIGQIQRTIGTVAAGQEDGSDELALAAHAGHVAAIASEISDCEERLGDSVHQIKAGTLNVRSATEASEKQLDTAVAHIQEMASSVAANASNIARIVNEFETMKNEIQSAIHTTQGLQRSVKNISVIANAISEISAQTNLLALNAAIEAARAREHGRGFAVVAGEVRNLAKRTDQATQEIHTIARGIDTEVSKTVTSLDNSASNARQYADQLNQMLESSAASARGAVTARELMDAVISQVSTQREAVSLIQTQLMAVEATAALSREQSSALRDVSDALSHSATQLAELADKVKP